MHKTIFQFSIYVKLSSKELAITGSTKTILSFCTPDPSITERTFKNCLATSVM